MKTGASNFRSCQQTGHSLAATTNEPDPQRMRGVHKIVLEYARKKLGRNPINPFRQPRKV